MSGFTLDEKEVKAAAKQLRITTAEQYRDPIVLTRLIELLVELKALGATVEQAAGLTAPSPKDAAAVCARELLHSKYGELQWHDLIKPIGDTLRERQRNALVDCLVDRDKLRGADDLYERYLIDVQTGTCLKTTRLLQATAATQLFVQRVLLNLESGLSLTDDKRKQWDWMRNYRVWEANRKVFLFPENWLLPELRDDKTAIFRQMESVLTEGEPSPEITRAALLTYLEELGDLSQISVIAMYEDERKVEETIVDETGASTVVPRMELTLYVIGRTPDQPYRYFWRSCAEFGSTKMSWSVWEALDLDNANDFIMPFVFEGDLHVAWPIFRKTTKEEAKKTTEGEDKTNVLLFWEVQIAWTRRTNKGWVKRKIGSVQLDAVKRLENKDSNGSFAFRLAKYVSEVSIPGSKPPMLWETISIYCYAAEEVDEETTSASEWTPDPNLKDVINAKLNHVGDIDRKTPNIEFKVHGQAYEYAVVDGVTKYRPMEGMSFKVSWYYKYTDNHLSNYTDDVSTTNKGEFHYTPHYFNKDGTENKADETLAANGGEVSITFNWPNKKAETVIKHLYEEETYELYNKWEWNFSVMRENKDIADDYGKGRVVRYLAAGSFIFEPGRDLRCTKAGMPQFDKMNGLIVKGNRFASQDGATGYIPYVAFGTDLDLWGPPPPGLALPLVIARATPSQVPGKQLVSPQVWYLETNDGGFYLQKQEDGWHTWWDGQPFASSYRSIVALSPGALFQPVIQTHLHNVPSANTFKRYAPYANYNWELFLHAPLAIADYLASQQRFEDARRWLHAVFDPTTEKTYLFSWDEIPGTDNTRLIEFLMQKFGIDWVKTAKIEKIDNGITIRFTDGNNFLSLKLNNERTEVNIEIDDGRTFELNARMENSKLNIYHIQQFWRFLQFYNAGQPDTIATLLTWLANPSALTTEAREKFEEDFMPQIEEWKKNPFMPHVIARLRPSAYQWHTFFAYLDVLIGWGDQLFRRDTRESVNEATLLYVLAAKLLGPRPRVIPAATPPYSLTYRLLLDKLDRLGNAWINYADLPGVKQLVSAKTGRSSSSQSFAPKRVGVGTVGEPIEKVPPRDPTGMHIVTSLSALAFCIPQNEKVTEFYDRVENRLFNVRNCRNIEGVFRDLPLYEPPIDPLLLIRARAAGLDIKDVLEKMYAPLPNYRFSFTLQKALELCPELKGLGGALLTALEKKDAEELTLLRSSHEITMLKLVPRHA